MTRKSNLLLRLAVLLCGLAFALPVRAGMVDPQVRQQLSQLQPGGRVPVIVTLRSQASPLAALAPRRQVRTMSRVERRDYRAGLIRTMKARSATSRRDLRQKLLRQGTQVTDLWLIGGLALSATPEQIAELEANPEVASISYDQALQLPRVSPMVDNNANLVEDNIDLLHAPDLWAQGFTGQNVTIAIVDSGVVVQHPDLNSRYRGGTNSWFNAVASTCGGTFVCTDCDNNTSSPCDYSDSSSVYHGTGVAGVAVGGDASGKSIGVAPGAKWIAAKIFRSDDSAPTSGIHAAFQWLLDPDGNPATDDAPDVVNVSWGYNPGNCYEEFRADIQVLKAAGIAVVLSAGNAGPAASTDVSPANYPEGFAVGSVGNSFTTQTTVISSFSSRGPATCDASIYPEVVAPGWVRTADYAYGGTSLYLDIAGTSFSSPEIAGVMALLLSADPTLTVAELEQALKDSATDLGTVGPDNDYGYGLVNASAAFNLLNLAPQLQIRDSVPPVDDSLVAFGDTVVGGSSNQDVTLSNSGGGTLMISGLDTGSLATPFAIISDTCTGANLVAGASCTVRIGFSPTAVGSFQGSFLITSNDAASPAQVSVTGQGVAASPPAQLTVSDSSGAAGDASVAFDQVPPGTSVVATITFGNAAGAGPLQLEGFDTTALPADYSVVDGGANPCGTLPRTLLAGQSCTVLVRFAPQVSGTSSGSFQVQSNDPASPTQISVSGLSNTPPPEPQLQSPADHATGQPTTVTLSWIQEPDSDTNDAVSNRILLGTTPDLQGATVITVTGSVLPATGAILVLLGLVFGLPAGLSRRLRLVLAVSLALLLLVACSGGGGGGSPAPSYLRSYTVSGLQPGTDYYWRVEATDSRGGSSASPVRLFVTQ